MSIYIPSQGDDYITRKEIKKYPTKTELNQGLSSKPNFFGNNQFQSDGIECKTINDVPFDDLLNNSNSSTDITTLQTSDTSQNIRLNLIEAKNNSQDTTITALQTSDTSQNTRLTNIEAKNNSQDTTISSHTSSINILSSWNNSTQNSITNINNQISNLQNTDALYNIRIGVLENSSSGGSGGVVNDYSGEILRIDNKNTEQDSRLSTLESNNTTVNSQITTIQGINTTQTTNISALQTCDESQNTRLTSIEGINTTQNNRLTVLETDVQNIKTTIASGGSGGGSGVDYSQDIARIDLKNSTQDNSITSLNTSISNLQDVNTTQSSQITAIQNINTTQNSRLLFLESSDISQESMINSFMTSIGNLQNADTSHESTLSTHTTQISNLNQQVSQLGSGGGSNVAAGNDLSLQYNNNGILGGLNGIFTNPEGTNLHIIDGDLHASNTVYANNIQYKNKLGKSDLSIGTDSSNTINIGMLNANTNILGNASVGNDLSVSNVKSSNNILNVCTQDNSVINIGTATSTVNVIGTLNNINVQDINVQDKNIVLNKGNAVSSGFLSGINIEEASTITGYMRVDNNRQSIELKPPNGALFKTPIDSASGNNLLYGTTNGSSAYTTNISTNGVGDLTVGNRVMVSTNQTGGQLNVGGGSIAIYPADSTSSSGILFCRDSTGAGLFTKTSLGANSTYPNDYSIATVNGSAISVSNSSRNVGILKDNASYALDVNGQIKSNCGLLPNTSGTSNQVLTSDGIGNINWSNVSAPNSNVRVISSYSASGDAYNMLSNDSIIVYSVIFNGSPTINLLSPSVVGVGKMITIKDGSGYAAQYPINITTPSGTIDNNVSTSIQMSSSYGNIELVSTGSKWVVTDKSGTMGKFIAYQSTSQSITNATTTSLVFETVSLKSGVFNDIYYFTSDATNRFFRNASARDVVWSITGKFEFVESGFVSNSNLIGIRVGSTMGISDNSPATNTFVINSGSVGATVSCTVLVPASSYVWMTVNQGSTSSKTCSTTNKATQIQIMQLA